jgi:hypothetical protein
LHRIITQGSLCLYWAVNPDLDHQASVNDCGTPEPLRLSHYGMSIANQSQTNDVDIMANGNWHLESHCEEAEGTCHLKWFLRDPDSVTPYWDVKFIRNDGNSDWALFQIISNRLSDSPGKCISTCPATNSSVAKMLI